MRRNVLKSYWILAFLLWLIPVHAEAAPLVPACPPDQLDQTQMMGTYGGEDIALGLEITACGSTYIVWDNAYGRHYASYGGTDWVPGEGIIARSYLDSPGRLDGVEVIGMKAAEPGYIQVFTMNQRGEIVHVYHLRKVYLR